MRACALPRAKVTRPGHALSTDTHKCTPAHTHTRTYPHAHAHAHERTHAHAYACRASAAWRTDDLPHVRSTRAAHAAAFPDGISSSTVTHEEQGGTNRYTDDDIDEAIDGDESDEIVE